MASTVSMTELVRLLQRNCAWQTSESSLLQDPTSFQELLVDATEKHNEKYTLTTTSSTIPRRERMAIVLLAWIEVCMIRASSFSSKPEISGGTDFSSDRATPFKKCLELAKVLQTKYSTLCESLGIEHAGTPHVSDFSVTDPSSSSTVPNAIAPAPPTVVLDAPVFAAGSATLTFSFDDFSDFYGVYVVTHTAAIMEPWNMNSSAGIPQVANAAAVGGPVQNFQQRSLKLTDLSTASGTVHHFLIVLRNRSNRYSYSNEVTYTVP